MVFEKCELGQVWLREFVDSRRCGSKATVEPVLFNCKEKEKICKVTLCSLSFSLSLSLSLRHGLSFCLHSSLLSFSIHFFSRFSFFLSIELSFTIFYLFFFICPFIRSIFLFEHSFLLISVSHFIYLYLYFSFLALSPLRPSLINFLWIPLIHCMVYFGMTVFWQTGLRSSSKWNWTCPNSIACFSYKQIYWSEYPAFRM